MTERGLQVLEALLQNDGQTIKTLWLLALRDEVLYPLGELERADFERHVVPNLLRTGLVQGSRERLWLTDAAAALEAVAEGRRRLAERALRRSAARPRSRVSALSE